ncbi:MAG TPA: hypothetical protein VGR62_10745 [Candidatus Binatia bacterium]|jgi:hypothetical protein|nr:hypothetical protein [Candidatus Binatia bacterium]
MRALPAVFAVVGGVAVVVFFVSLGMAAREPARCAGGRFLVEQAPLMPGSSGADAVILTGQRIEIASGCRNIRGVIERDGRGTWVDARWPRGACGNGTPPARLRARFVDDCGEMVGNLRARGAARRSFVAHRSVCGDGIIDAGAGEACEGTDFGGHACPAGIAGTACMRCTETCQIEVVPLAVGGGIDFKLDVHGTGRFAIMELDPDAYERWRLGKQTVQEVRTLVRTTSQFFADVFDFVVLVTDEDSVAPDVYHGLHYQVQNDTDGIGPHFDSTERFGLWSRLQGVIHLSYEGSLRSAAGLHEFAHRWANYVIPTSANTSDAHWNFSDVGGQLGGWQAGTLVELGDGLYQARGPGDHVSFQPFANGGATVPYASLELYLMGLIGADEVTDVHVAEEAEFVDSANGIFRADRIRTVTMADILAEHGPRIPDVTTSQKAFRTLVVVLAREALGPERLALYDDDIRAFSTAGDDGTYLFNFWEATGGRASMQMDGLFGAMRSVTAQTNGVALPTSGLDDAPPPID